MGKLFTSILYLTILTTPLLANFFTSVFQDNNSKELYLKYSSYPTNVYTQQRFNVKLEAIILTPKDDYDSIVTTYSNEKNIILLDNNISWKESTNNTYTTKITYKSKKYHFTLPTLKLALIKDGVEIKSISLKPPKIKYNKIALNQARFSNIIATHLDINSINTKQYNNTMLMAVINLSTTSGNLEEFNLNQFEEQGIESFQELNGKQNMYYYVLIPNHIKTINFDYYNPNIRQFINVELPVILNDELISTQTDLNPNDSSLLIYKQILIILVLVISLFLYIRTKNKLFIFAIAISLFIVIKLVLPNEKIYIPKDTKIYILPTSSSTIYKIVETKSEAEILIKQKEFIKVLFQNGHIGWIKESNVK